MATHAQPNRPSEPLPAQPGLVAFVAALAEERRSLGDLRTARTLVELLYRWSDGPAAAGRV